MYEAKVTITASQPKQALWYTVHVYHFFLGVDTVSYSVFIVRVRAATWILARADLNHDR
jgi:hypothetical protein